MEWNGSEWMNGIDLNEWKHVYLEKWSRLADQKNNDHKWNGGRKDEWNGMDLETEWKD